MVGDEAATSAVVVVDTSTPSTVVTAGVDGVEIARFEHDGFHHLECIGDLVARSEQALIDRGVRLGAIGVVGPHDNCVLVRLLVVPLADTLGLKTERKIETLRSTVRGSNLERHVGDAVLKRDRKGVQE